MVSSCLRKKGRTSQACLIIFLKFAISLELPFPEAGEQGAEAGPGRYSFVRLQEYRREEQERARRDPGTFSLFPYFEFQTKVALQL